VPTHVLPGGQEHLSSSAPLARPFYEWLGFRYASIDIDGSPGSVPLDLNYDDVPAGEIGKYHLVTNFGTTEHVANQLNAFAVIHDLTALGGIMLHQLPAQGYMNHGLVNYNPKYFWMLARSNGYKLIDFDFSTSTTQETLPKNITDMLEQFRPGTMERSANFRAVDAGLTFVLQKTFATPYVAPIDVQTGTVMHNQALKQRYWTVFEPNAFDRLHELVPLSSPIRSTSE
jgi:hypothetical protein